MKLYLNPNEVSILRYFELSTPEEVLDCYRRTHDNRLEDIYLKTLGMLDLRRRL